MARRAPAFALAAFVVLFLALQIGRLTQKSNGFDELAYIAQGQLHLRRGEFEMSRRRHPPLAKYLSALPLAFSDVQLPASDGKNAYRFGFEYLYLNTRPAPFILLASRLPMLLLPVCIALVLFLWGTRLGDPWSGAIAAVLLMFEPNMMAHSGLVMTDVCLAATLLGAAFAASNYFETGDAHWRTAVGVMLGLALLSKATALFFVPVAAFVFFLRSGAKRAAMDLMIVAGVSLLIVAIGYRITGFKYWWIEIADRLREGSDPSLATATFGSEGIMGGSPLNYLKKSFYKCALPFLIVAGWSAWRLKKIPRALAAVSWGTVGIFFISTLFNRTQSAMRYMIPAFPFVMLPFLRDMNSRSRTALGVLALATVAVSVNAYPDYLPYTNIFYRDAGLPIFNGSEYDFGQDLPALAKFQRVHPQDAIDFCYFGIADPAAYGVRAQWLPWYPALMQDPNPVINPDNPAREWLAISVGSLQGHKDRDLFTWMKEPPQFKLAKTIWLWDITNRADIHRQLLAWYGRYGWRAQADREQRWLALH